MATASQQDIWIHHKGTKNRNGSMRANPLKPRPVDLTNDLEKEIPSELRLHFQKLRVLRTFAVNSFLLSSRPGARARSAGSRRCSIAGRALAAPPPQAADVSRTAGNKAGNRRASHGRPAPGARGVVARW